MSAATELRIHAAALEMTGISAGYGDTTVLRDVSLTVEAGSVVALLGPNGAGKTTLLKVASGLLQPRSGEVSIAGIDSTRTAPFKRRRAGLCLIPEGRGVFPSLTIRENLYVQVPRRERSSALERVVAAFPVLGQRLGQPAGRLSGGQQQMLALARCYLQHPQIVLADELSMGLAPLIIDEVYEALSALREQGVAILLVEQYVDRALSLADTVRVLNKGRITDGGSAATVDRDELMRHYLYHADSGGSHSVENVDSQSGTGGLATFHQSLQVVKEEPA